MVWKASLQLHYKNTGSAERPRSGLDFLHEGPLRVLQSLYPEGERICHNVLIHPPSGIVSGDLLDIAAQLDPGTHAVITTPGATRFYKSSGDSGTQQVQVHLAEGARLEWLPLETIAYNGCNAVNRAVFRLASNAEMIGWDITAFGLPHAHAPFDHGVFQQHIEIPGSWLERARIDASDTHLLNSPLGMAGMRCMGTLFFASGSTIARERRETLLDAVRTALGQSVLMSTSGATAPNPRMICVRTLSHLVEPTLNTLRACWSALRRAGWALESNPPRIWSM